MMGSQSSVVVGDYLQQLSLMFIIERWSISDADLYFMLIHNNTFSIIALSFALSSIDFIDTSRYLEFRYSN
jgi:hypothetical protein